MADFWKTAAISNNLTGDQPVVAAVAGKRIIVVAYVLTSADAKTVTWKSGTTAISGALHFAINSSVRATAPGGWGRPVTPLLKTALGQALNINASTTGVVSGHVTYYEEDREL